MHSSSERSMSWNKCLLSLSSITHCSHILKGGAHTTPKSIIEDQKFLHPFSLLWKAPFIKIIGLKQRDQISRIWCKLVPAPLRLTSSCIKPAWGCYQAQVTQKSKLFNYAGLHHIPHSVLALRSFLVKCQKYFLVDEHTVLNPEIALILLFRVFDKICRSVS